ncbi:MAG TPA: hypothetical protein VEQ61_05685 [Thermoleophilaceae bacterium]|nr:hypothetical protein [Thermoleophilaceae bacterium]
MEDGAARGMAAIGGAVASGSALSPRTFLRRFGLRGAEVTGAAELGWRLFAVRTAYLSALAASGDEAARRAFLPVQVLDQAVFWQAFATRSVPRRAAVMAATASGVIIVLDLTRRAQCSREPD